MVMWTGVGNEGLAQKRQWQWKATQGFAEARERLCTTEGVPCTTFLIFDSESLGLKDFGNSAIFVASSRNCHAPTNCFWSEVKVSINLSKLPYVSEADSLILRSWFKHNECNVHSCRTPVSVVVSTFNAKVEMEVLQGARSAGCY